jgi:hypothetical protein
MSTISRIDRVIAVALVVLLLTLLGIGLAHRSAPSHPASPATDRGAVALGKASPSGPPPSGNPTTSRATTDASTTSASTAAPSTTTISTDGAASTSVTDPPPAPIPGPVSAVGDSIMLDIQPYLATDIPGAQINGLVSRQFESGIAVVQAEKAAGTLGNVLVVELGTNGTVTSADFDVMMQAASGVKRVVFVNINVPRPWEAPDNAVLAAGVAQYPGLAVLVNWNAVSSGHPEWFTPDQVHLEPAGAQALANLVEQYT